ncbi:MAG: hypothetical protein IT454_20135 [Planctomycetes bacterium]|nr:hypothetical protein [Planctomycetota bacterium]
MKLSIRHSLACLGLALATVACAPSSDAAAPKDESSVSIFLSSTPSGAAVRRMHEATLRTRYSGVRRVEQHWRVDKVREQLEYRESVACDGLGQFSLAPVEHVAPAISVSEEAIWTLLQEAREGFLFRYRDFAIRDVRAFARNYTITLLGTSVQVAGRDCDEMLVQRRKNANSLYTIAVDRGTGLVLRTRQTELDGTLIGVNEFESIDFAPTFQPPPTWHVASNSEQPLPPGSAGAQLLGFAPKLPTTDGGSFVLLDLTRISSVDPSGVGTLHWAKSTLTDGVEVVIFVHAGPDPSYTGDDAMRVSPSVGPWNHVDGTLQGERLMALGRVSSDELLDLMEAVL